VRRRDNPVVHVNEYHDHENHIDFLDQYVNHHSIDHAIIDNNFCDDDNIDGDNQPNRQPAGTGEQCQLNQI